MTDHEQPPEPLRMALEFHRPHTTAYEQKRATAQGHTIAWTIPHVSAHLNLNGHKVGHVDAHLHAAWAPDGIPDTSFGFTGRINTLELLRALPPDTLEHLRNELERADSQRGGA